jgi:hypothetical protein
MRSQADLMQVVTALGAARRFASGLDCRHQKRDQDRDDCDYDQ